MRLLVLVTLLSCLGWGQNPSSSPGAPSGASPANPASQQGTSKDSGSPSASSSTTPDAAPRNPHLQAPRSDTVDASAIESGESSSKDSQIDLSPPADDAKAHPNGSDTLTDEGSGSADAEQFRYWDPHKAAKDVEVGDFYFKRRNFAGAEDRYREALLYKPNDAIATFHLAECLDKMKRPGEARDEYEAYLKILPNGPESERAKKALARLKTPSK